MRSIGTYFKVVDADEHRIIEELRSLRERKRKEADDRTAADAAKAKSIRIREGYARANELRKNKTIEEALIPQVLVDPNIAMIENFDIVGEDDEAVAAEQKPRRKQLYRPKNWEVIAEFYGQWGKRAAMKQFGEQLSDRSFRSIEQALVVWLEDFRAQKHNTNVGNRAPSYGNRIDLLLLGDVKARMLAGLPVDDVALRFLLVPILQANDLSELLSISMDGLSDSGSATI